MKNLIITLCMSLTFVCFGTEREKISLPVGGIKTIDLPFALENYRASPKSKIKVETSGDKQLRVIGKEQGHCELHIYGGGISKKYAITVISNIRRILSRLRNDLGNMPELDIAVNQDYIVIRGTVCKPENWNHLKKVLLLYKDNCHSFAIFKPSTETVLNLKKMLVDAGYKFVEKGQTQKTGELCMNISRDAITISGKVFSKSDLVAINQILSTQTWLQVGSTPKTGSGKVRGIINVKVVPAIIDIGIVYVGITDIEAHSLGSNNIPFGKVNLSSLSNLITGSSNSANLGGGLNETIKFLAANGVTRFKTAGHLTFMSNDPSGTSKSFHSGGTMKVRVHGQKSGGLIDVNYGFIIKAKGGLIGNNKVKLDLQIEKNDPPTSTGVDYDMKTNKVDTSVICELDRTVVLAGFKDLTEGTTEPSGTPILRNTPILKWFVSQEGESRKDMRLLILVSPRIMVNNPDVEIKIPPSTQTASTYYDAGRSNKERIEEKKRYRGWLNWLNWFSF